MASTTTLDTAETNNTDRERSGSCFESHSVGGVSEGMDVSACPECGEPVSVNSTRTETYCKDCGLVVARHEIDPG